MDQWSLSDRSGLVTEGACHGTSEVLTDQQFPELVVASYNKNSSAPSDPDGLVAVWNLHLLERPEFIFHSSVGRTRALATRD